MFGISEFDRHALIDWSERLLSTLGPRANANIAQTVQEAVDVLRQQRFYLAVLGKAKRGKSTLINALLGRKDDLIAPVDKLPVSSAISRFRYADREQAVVVFRDGRRQPIGFERIREFVTEDHNRENVKAVDVVEIEGPFPGLQAGLELVDTPGAGSIHEHHDALLHAFIPQADAVIFLVTARMPLDQDELELLQKVKEADTPKMFFAINRVDECGEQDIQDAIAHNTALLARVKLDVKTIHRISAKRAFQGDLAGSGLLGLMDEIGQFLASSKGRVLAARFVSRVCNAVQPLAQAIDLQLASSGKTAAQIEADLRSLQQQKVSMERERHLAERKFQADWSKAVAVFKAELNKAHHQATTEATNRISETGVFEISRLARQLPTVLTEIIETHLAPPAQHFEQAVCEATRNILASYPELRLADGIRVGLLPPGNHHAAVGVAGGTAVAAVGVGFALAGEAAAATIAAANAAALSATTTVAAPSVISTLLASAGPGWEFLAPLATGTATVAAPAAVTITPLWVALAGPVGWTLAGLGALAVPFAWKLSRERLREKIVQVAREHIDNVFRHVATERVPHCERMGTLIIEDLRLTFDTQLSELEARLVTLRDQLPDPAELAELTSLNNHLRKLLSEGADFCTLSQVGT
uniref:Dynamin N-terminal domain-containing protein n=1 Tax=Schlesneria paludicola TaxID=360056 RepID=A0A7C4LK29_9PLAN